MIWELLVCTVGKEWRRLLHMHAVQYPKCEIRENWFCSGIVQEIETKIETIVICSSCILI